MEREWKFFFVIEDAIFKVHRNLQKFKDYKDETKQKKVVHLNELKEQLKSIIKDSTINFETRLSLLERDKHLRKKVYECLKNLKRSPLETTLLENQSILVTKKQDSREESEDSENSDSFEESEFEDQFKMPPKLDLGTALKLVDKFSGDAEKLASFFETLDLLKDYNEGVPEVDLLKFIKTRLTGPAHGVANTAVTIADAKRLLKNKFAIKFSPQAIESEMGSIKQKKKKNDTQ